MPSAASVLVFRRTDLFALTVVVLISTASASESGCSVRARTEAAFLLEESLLLARSSSPGAASRAWTADHIEAVLPSQAYTLGDPLRRGRLRVGQGFISSFTYSVAGRGGDGFAFAVHNGPTVDLQGGTSGNLGTLGLKSGVVVRFDLCPGSPRPTDCTSGANSLEAFEVDAQGVHVSLGPKIVLSGADSLRGDHRVEVAFLNHPSNVTVSVDGNLLLSVALKSTATAGSTALQQALRRSGELEGSRFAFLGFTASTSWNSAADITVKRWEVDVPTSDSRLEVPEKTLLIGGPDPATEYLDYVVQFLDSCGNVAPPHPLRAVLQSAIGARAPFFTGEVSFSTPTAVNVSGVDIEAVLNFAETNVPFPPRSPSRGHNWHIHTDPIEGAAGNCSSAGPHYDPDSLEVAGYSCNMSSAPAACYKGDLAGKFGTLEVPMANSSRFTDSSLELSELYGLSVVIHAGEGKGDKVACGKITLDPPLSVSATVTMVENPERVFMPEQIYNPVDGTLTLRFRPTTIGTFVATVSVDGVPTNSGAAGGRSSVQYFPAKDGSGISPGFLALAIVAALVLVLVIVYTLRRLIRYRRKLLENQAHIVAGKKQWQLDEMERDLKYSANPLQGSIDELRERLEQNEAELARLRCRRDMTALATKLEAERNALVEELNRLKRQEQMRLSGLGNPQNGDRHTAKRKEWGQQRAAE